MSPNIVEEGVVGEWGGGKFVFKLVEKEDHPKVRQHLKDCFYYGALYRIGYTKDLDDEMDALFATILNDGYNMNFIVVEKATGKVAGCRVITMDSRAKVAKSQEDDPNSPLKSPVSKNFVKFYYSLLIEGNPFDRFNEETFPHMFGISVDPEFAQQGLATEIYRRAILLMKARGFKFVLVGFVSPYSRAAAAHHGFIRVAQRALKDAKNDKGQPLFENTDPNDFLDVGLFEL